MLDLSKRQKEILKGIAFVAFYLIYSKYLSEIPLLIANVDLTHFPIWVRVAYFLITDIFFLSLIGYIYFPTLKKDLKDFKKHAGNYIDIGIRYWVLGVIGMVTSSFIITFILDGGIAQNEQAVRNLISAIPYYMLFSTAIYAPITEEITFRKAFKDIFGRNLFFVLASGIVFGSMHVIFSAQTFVQYLQIIPYSSVGIALAYTYYKTDNIFAPMFVHFMHNFTFTLLIMVLGL